MVQLYKITVTFAVIVLMMACFIHQSLGRPQSTLPRHIIDDVKKCELDEHREEACQRCAKSTKSPVVYPMCCAGKEGVDAWCNQYLNYGIH